MLTGGALTVVGAAYDDALACFECPFGEGFVANTKAEFGKIRNVGTVRKNFSTCRHNMVGCDIIAHF